MIYSFPTPFPDELWFSVLSRYALSSCTPKRITMANLFREEETKSNLVIPTT